jgi:hypothetical protein
MKDTYTPVPYEYREEIEEQLAKQTSGKIFFFDGEGKVNEAIGRITKNIEIPGEGIFIVIDDNEKIRIDKIITIFGKPGPAHSTYDAFGNVCFECTGGYEL